MLRGVFGHHAREDAENAKILSTKSYFLRDFLPSSPLLREIRMSGVPFFPASPESTAASTSAQVSTGSNRPSNMSAWYRLS